MYILVNCVRDYIRIISSCLVKVNVVFIRYIHIHFRAIASQTVLTTKDASGCVPFNLLWYLVLLSEKA